MGRQSDDLPIEHRHVTKRYPFVDVLRLDIRFRLCRLSRAIPTPFINYLADQAAPHERESLFALSSAGSVPRGTRRV